MDQAAENMTDTVDLNVALETLTEEGTATPISEENSTNIVPDKRRRNTKDKTENEKSKTTNVDAENVNDVSASNRKNSKRKAKQPPISEMIMDSITNRRLRNGATFEEICNYMENKYSVNMKVLKPQIHKFLKESVDKCVLDKSDGAGGDLKFKIKKSENKKENATPIIKKNSNNIEHVKQVINIKDKTENKKPKTTNVDAKIMKAAPETERKNLKRKAEHPPTPEMVMDSIKTLKKYKGATLEDITKHMEEKYSVSMKVLKSHVNKFLKKSVDIGVLDKSDGTGGEEKFKIKKPENKKENATPIIKKNNNKIEHGKQAINRKDKTENKKPKTTNVDAKIIKDAPALERKSLKRKAEHPPTSEMVMDSIKALKKYKGATFEDITKHMKEKYSVNMKVLKSHVNKFLKKSVDNGALDKIDGTSGEEKFKIKKSENKKKSAKELPGKKVKGKPTKKIGAKKKAS